MYPIILSLKQLKVAPSHLSLIAHSLGLLLLQLLLLLHLQFTVSEHASYDRLTTLCDNSTDTSLCLSNSSHSNCLCDDLCPVYDDCCVDAQTLRPSPTVASISLPPDVIDCTYLHSRTHKQGLFLVVTKCPAIYTNVHIRQLCESESEDMFLNLPVNGHLSVILYKNVYCAACNNEPHIRYWTAEKNVCDWSTTNYLKEQVVNGKQSNILSEEAETLNCPIVFSSPMAAPPRPCRHVVRECAGNWTDDVTRRRCEEKGATRYVHLPFSTEGEGEKDLFTTWTTYRNVHCAECNYISYDQLRCDMPQHSRTDMYMVQRGRCKIVSKRVPFSVIMDINRSQKSLQDHRGDGKVLEEVTFLESCPEGQVYDPFSQSCRIVYCPSALLVLTPGGCVPISEQSINDNAHMISDSEYKDTQSNLSILASLNQTTYNVTRYINSSSLGATEFDDTQAMISFICVLLSLVCLVVQFIVYMTFSELRNLPGRCVVSLVVALFTGLLMYMFVSPVSHWLAPACFYTGVVMHYAFLAAFFWMNVLAIDICGTFTAKTGPSSSSSATLKRFTFYSLYAWLAPAIIVGSSVTLDLTHPRQHDVELNETAVTNWASSVDTWAPAYGESLCWINQSSALLVWFVVPLSLILVVNLVLFTVSVYSIHTATMTSLPAAKSNYIHQLFIFAKLLIVMGLTWLLGLMATFINWSVLWYMFTIFNSLQGAFVAISFTCTKKVFKIVRSSLSRQKKKNKKNRGRGTQQDSYNRNYSNVSSTATGTRTTSVL